MTKTRKFALADILSVTTGVLVSPRKIDAVYDVMDFVTGEVHTTIGLMMDQPRAAAMLLEQHRDLAEIAVPKFEPGDKAAVAIWLVEMMERYGSHRDLVGG